MIPDFNPQGNLPFGIYEVRDEEFFARLATTDQRRALATRLREFIQLARESGLVERLIVWGSYVTAKDHPQDVDVLLVAKEGLEPDHVPAGFRVLFDYALARQRFDMDVFWAQAGARALIQEVLEMAHTDRNRAPRGIVEIKLR